MILTTPGSQKTYPPESVQLGDLIELIEMTDDPDPIPPGSRGIVICVWRRLTPTTWGSPHQPEGEVTRIEVDWTPRRGLVILPPTDTFKILYRPDPYVAP